MQDPCGGGDERLRPVSPVARAVALAAAGTRPVTSVSGVLLVQQQWPFFIGVWLIYNAVLVSSVQQSESAIRTHISPLF